MPMSVRHVHMNMEAWSQCWVSSIDLHLICVCMLCVYSCVQASRLHMQARCQHLCFLVFRHQGCIWRPKVNIYVFLCSDIKGAYGGQGLTSVSSSYYLPHYFLGQSFSLNLELSWLAIQSLDPPVSTLKSWDFRHTLPHLAACPHPRQ